MEKDKLNNSFELHVYNFKTRSLMLKGQLLDNLNNFFV